VSDIATVVMDDMLRRMLGMFMSVAMGDICLLIWRRQGIHKAVFVTLYGDVYNGN
jgi:hypothetical protein